jgi:anti-sigma-K factor RskA
MSNPSALSEDDLILVEDYVLGELSPEAAAALERRVRSDQALRQELCALQATLRLLPQAMPILEAPPELRDRILTANTLRSKILTADTPTATARRSRSASGATIPWGKIAVGIAAALALLLGADNLRLRQALGDADQTNRELLAQLNQNDENDGEVVANLLQRPTSRLVTLEGESNETANAAGTLLFTPGRWQQVVVSLGNLDPLPPDEIYRMWLTLENGQTIFCGEFNTDEQGNVFVELRPDEAVPQGVKATGIFVTVESASAPPEPSGERVMAGSI